ncbi:hypothetical protein CFP65_6551 [Kitasatospora sp. MMS16-BH015]|uniref:hypothetical protein n=1 Tax=Kitasatospora sp. MMS16-BH015 TaxID=2018025 RepID=UPI000CA3ACD5|nr:hypothetical protein [Kitasatospora sp. MMS16-BH015]AUG81201.1 hypothetical protein CFP65_6551 [Kitasatospora sp. MMS16-BH015]
MHRSARRTALLSAAVLALTAPAVAAATGAAAAATADHRNHPTMVMSDYPQSDVFSPVPGYGMAYHHSGHPVAVVS